MTEPNNAGPTFNAQSESGEIKQAMKIVEGDEVAGDKDASQTSTTETHVAGDMHGDIKGGDNIQVGSVELLEQVKDAFDEMAKEAEAQGVPAYQPPIEARTIPGGDPSDEVVFDDFESLDIPEIDDGSDHPAAVYASVQRFSDTPMPEEEQKTLFQRMKSCVKKYATQDNAVKALKVVASGVGAMATLAPPLNIIKAVCETAAQVSE